MSAIEKPAGEDPVVTVGVQAFSHQVAGHKKKNGVGGTFLDSDGHLLKATKLDERSEREGAFYLYATQCRDVLSRRSLIGTRTPTTDHEAPTLASSDQEVADRAADSISEADEPSSTDACAVTSAAGIENDITQRNKDWLDSHLDAVSCVVRVNEEQAPLGVLALIGLTRYLPICYGRSTQGSQSVLCLSNACHGYEHPSVVDIKIGFRTTYPWASDTYNSKNTKKDAAGTQGVHGFKISGMSVYNPESTVSMDKSASAEASLDMPQFLRSFADNGGEIEVKDVWQPVLDDMQAILLWAQQPRVVGWRLFSASLLVVYEGSATSPDSLNPRCCLIDFAHAFLVEDADAVDTNFVQGLESLIKMVQSICA